MTGGNTRSARYNQREENSADREKEFLTSLTNLANTLGIGINEDAKLFVMEAEDYAFSYFCDANGQLQRL